MAIVSVKIKIKSDNLQRRGCLGDACVGEKTVESVDKQTVRLAFGWE